MRIHIRGKAIALVATAMVIAFTLCGFGWEPIPIDDPHGVKQENSDVANQKSVYGQAISTAEFYNQKNEYKEQISELEKRIAQLEKENEELKAKNNEYEISAELSESEWQALCKIAVSEAGYTSEESQKNIVKVILNRVESTKFADSVIEVIAESGQFEPYSNGSYSKVKVTDEMIEMAKSAYTEWKDGEDIMGALYFCRGTFDGLTYLFEDDVHHRFFK